MSAAPRAPTWRSGGESTTAWERRLRGSKAGSSSRRCSSGSRRSPCSTNARASGAALCCAASGPCRFAASGPERLDALGSRVAPHRRLLADARAPRCGAAPDAAPLVRVRHHPPEPAQDRRPRRREGRSDPHPFRIGLPRRCPVPPAGRPARNLGTLTAGAACPRSPPSPGRPERERLGHRTTRLGGSRRAEPGGRRCRHAPEAPKG